MFFSPLVLFKDCCLIRILSRDSYRTLNRSLDSTLASCFIDRMSGKTLNMCTCFGPVIFSFANSWLTALVFDGAVLNLRLCSAEFRVLAEHLDCRKIFITTNARAFDF
jgi:hypothetical protein